METRQENSRKNIRETDIEIHVNGAPYRVEADLTVSRLLERLKIRGRYTAVAVNGSFVAKGAYGQTQLTDADQIDVVAPMAGG